MSTSSGKWASPERIRPHHRSKTWQLAKRLAVEIYEITQNYPDRERFGLAAHTRKTATSLPSNIAEGKGRRTDADFLRFLYNTRGSLEELDTQMELADDLGFLRHTDTDSALTLFDNLSPTLQALINTVERDANR